MQSRLTPRLLIHEGNRHFTMSDLNQRYCRHNARTFSDVNRKLPQTPSRSILTHVPFIISNLAVIWMLQDIFTPILVHADLVLKFA